MTNAPPSHDAASEDVLAGSFIEAYKKFLQSTDNMLPARIINYDRTTNRAHVQPMIMVLTTTGERVQRQGTFGVPVYQMGGGGFFMSFNLVAGNLGWIKASDRDMSLFLQSYNESEPNTKRLHSFSDSVFFPDIMKDYTIAGEDAGNMVIQNADASVKISLWPAKIKIKAPVVEIDSPTTSISGAVTIASTLTVTGQIESSADVKVGSILLSTHKHLGVMAGGDTSGLPTP